MDEKCERIKSWQDEEGEIHRDRPFHLHPNNYLAMELYSRTARLSTKEHYNWERGKKMMTGWFPTLSALEFVLDRFAPDMTSDDMDLLVDKIATIHQVKLDNFLV